jgi:hypothetical protein
MEAATAGFGDGTIRGCAEARNSAVERPHLKWRGKDLAQRYERERERGRGRGKDLSRRKERKRMDGSVGIGNI